MTPYRSIWSLYNVLRFYANFFTIFSAALERLHRDLLVIDNWQTEVESIVGAVRTACGVHRFDHLEGQARRVIEKAKKIPSSENIEDRRREVKTLIQELRLGIDHKLKSCTFIRISTNRVKFYSEDDNPLFGPKVQDKFFEATHDIAEAGRCFALERWDATVYHLMLATEHALRKWARNLGVKTQGRPLELMDWKPIIDCAKDRLDHLRGLKKNALRARNIERLADQLAHFGFIKDAYRNVCSHGRAPYDELKATSIMNHVQAFMQSLA